MKKIIHMTVAELRTELKKFYQNHQGPLGVLASFIDQMTLGQLLKCVKPWEYYYCIEHKIDDICIEIYKKDTINSYILENYFPKEDYLLINPKINKNKYNI